MLLFLSEIPVFILTAAKDKTHFFYSLIIFIFVVSTAMIIRKNRSIGFRFSLSHPAGTTIICSILALSFFKRWGNSYRMKTIAIIPGLQTKQSVLIIAFFLALLSLAGVDNLINIFSSLVPGKTGTKGKAKEDVLAFLFIFLSAFLFLFINSKSSPLYPFNDGVDPNTMFTVGKGVTRGFVPYRDLYEQKGPLLIFLHSFGALVSFDSFLGVWILEVIFSFFFIYYAYKTTSIFFKKKTISAIAILPAAIYSSKSFQAGDLAEEFALPLAAYAVYLACKMVEKNEFLSKKEAFLIGITSGSIFWMKYSMTGFYLGWYLVLFILSVFQKDIKRLINRSCFILLGIIAATAPIFSYFLINSSLEYLFQAYFYNNMVYYAYTGDSLFRLLTADWYYYSHYSFAHMLLSFMGLFYMIYRKKWGTVLFILSAFFSTYISVYINGHHHIYYSFILGVFSIFGLCFISDIFSVLSSFLKNRFPDIYTASSIVFFLSTLFLCFYSQNLQSLEIPKDEMFQYKMKNIIERSDVKDPKLLNYYTGDLGVNTVAGIIPNLRYFCYYNNEKFEDIINEQNECLNNQCVDFVLQQSSSPYTYKTEINNYDYRGNITFIQDGKIQFIHYFTPKDMIK